MIQGHPDNPLLVLGADLGLRHDTAALAAVYRDPRDRKIILRDFRIFKPPVSIARFEDAILGAVERNTVVGIYFDWWQMASTQQRLIAEGHGRILHECNQATESVAFSNILKEVLDEKNLMFLPNAELRNQFKWANVEVGERGWRIVKRKQSRPIDIVIATAMAVYGCTMLGADLVMKGYSQDRHVRSIFDLVEA